eukprot:1904294-Rhodomonas_salina.1
MHARNHEKYANRYPSHVLLEKEPAFGDVKGSNDFDDQEESFTFLEAFDIMESVMDYNNGLIRD